ncbi:MAG: glycogen/starch synthase [Candidatus Roizmanbacteria bacterium]|nr:glycogen/starch synthase [Candidatus Roizmanbacteria bacterium]
MNILFVSWEVDPFFKVGGLGDIARSLPKALHNKNIDISLAVPLYDAVKFHGQETTEVGQVSIVYDGKKITFHIIKTTFPDVNIPIYFFKNKKYLSIPMADTFAVFNMAIIESIRMNALQKPDIIHCNDNHAGFIPLLVKHHNLPIKTLLTIHNLNNFGRAGINQVIKMGIDPNMCTVLKWEIQKRQINFLLEGIVHADKVNAVSETYAKEILTEEYGSGIDEVLTGLSNKITGILNGIDYEVRNPTNDTYLKYTYDIKASGNLFDITKGKANNKAYLQKKLEFDIDPNIPLIGFIGRFDSKQKGVQLLHRVINRIDKKRYQFVVLGTGEPNWEERYLWLSQFYKNVYYKNVFDEELASQMYAGCDFLIIPSKFEPCGLIQMIAMRYGCIPIARATGGLKDTIRDGDTGFLFEEYTSTALENTLIKAATLFRTDKDAFASMRIRAMKEDFSWNQSAEKYIKLYKELLG